MSVGELVNSVDESLVLELYEKNKSSKFEHKGTYNLDVESSRNHLLSHYGSAIVKHRDIYKAYVLVYLEG